MNRLLIWLFVCALGRASVAAPLPPSKANSPQPAPDGSRFLFVVDTSRSMRPMEEATRQTLFNMIFTGLDGQMRTGDTFGLWTFDEETGAGDFPMQVWDAQNPIDTASRAAMYLRGHKFNGSARPENLLPKLRAVIRAVADVNIFLLSVGEPLQGIAFEDGINAEYQKRGNERIHFKKPFVTTWIARGGKITGAYVVIAGQPLPVPNRPAPAVAATPKNLTPVLASVATSNAVAGPMILRESPTPNPILPIHPNPSPPVTATAPALPPPVARVEVMSSAASTNEPTAQPIPAGLSAESVPAPPAPSAPATPRHKVMQIVTKTNSPAPNIEVAPIETAATVTETNTSPARGTLTNGPLVVAQEPPSQPKTSASTPSPDAQKTSAGALSILPAPMPVAAREAPVPNQSEPPRTLDVVAVSAPQNLNASLLLGIGGLLLLLAVFLMVVVLRRLRPVSRPSFITQSMERR